jgi:hypothetical protein
MYRKPRGGGSQSILNLDSLMDILSCLVGVMLFLVIYTVLELGSTTYQVSVPVPLDRPQEARRILVLANDGTIRLLDTARPIAELTVGLNEVAFEDAPGHVRQVNSSPPTDAFFRYELGYDEERALLIAPDSALSITVSEIPGERGDGLAALGEGSEFEGLLGLYNPRQVWFEFGVDGASLDVFRRARQMAEERGFATRWGPLDLDFPVRFALNDQTEGPAPRDLLSKPRR